MANARGNEYSGHPFIKRFAGQLRSAIPDTQIIEVKFLAQDDNAIVWQRTLRGTNKVEMKGIPPSGKKVKWIDMVVSSFNNEQIAEEWVVS
ncbi:MAG: ester cyclase [Candidatus Thiodiazotropha sp. (ex Epidulcina cf. delphinae)]|nr:ester cyclase [Candidatus Thiodiazotropha sp. (ex Epidulcina cf. delphinae)]